MIVPMTSGSLRIMASGAKGHPGQDMQGCRVITRRPFS